MPSSEHVLVTGGAGFIGSCLARQLLETGRRVTIVDNLSNGLMANVPEGTTFVELDISDRRALSGLAWDDFDAVCHLAAQSSGTLSFDDPERDMESHVVGTFNLLQNCRSHGVNRFLYASSTTTYGEPESLPATEDVAQEPKTYYATGKVAAEKYVRFFQQIGVDTTILRMPNVYGPGQNLENMSQGIVSIYLAFLLRNEPVMVKGNLERFRDFIHVEDTAAAWVAALDAPAAVGRTYNLASGKPTTVKEVLDALLDAFGSPDHPIEVTEGTPGDQQGVYCDISKITADLNWKPVIPFSEGIKQTVAAEKAKLNR